MKIETATLVHGSPVRQVLLEQTPSAPARTKTVIPPGGRPRGWRWAASIARLALGINAENPKKPPEIEFR
jgi:hypothetical protein